MWGKLTFLDKIRKKVNFPRDPFLENPQNFFRLRRANLPCKVIIFEAQNPKIFRLRRAFPLEKYVSNHFAYKKSLAAGQFTL